MILTVRFFDCREPYVILFVRDRVKASPPSSIGTNLTLFVRVIAYPISPIGNGTKVTLLVCTRRTCDCCVPGTGTLRHSLILTLSLWLTWLVKFKSIVYGTHVYIQKISVQHIYGTGSKCPNDGHDLDSNQLYTFVYLQKYLAICRCTNILWDNKYYSY